jgi:hypothetical protein
MRIKQIINTGAFIITMIVVTGLFSCSKDDAHEAFITGSWMIEKVEKTTFQGGAPVNTETFKDTCGFILLYSGTPGHIYAVIKYPSNYFTNDFNGYWEAWDWKETGKYTVTISNRDISVSNDNYRKRKQIWTYPESVTDGVQEKLYLKKD